MKGLIIGITAGVYAIESSGETFKGRARGIFRKNGIKPIVGDSCTISINPDGTCVVEEIYERKNSLTRPPLANLDKIFFVVSMDKPKPNLLVLDELIAISEKQEIEPIIVITKIDIEKYTDFYEVYSKIYKTYVVDYTEKSSIDKIKEEIKNNISAFSGNSGVGKSTLLNAIDNKFEINTAKISEKLGRGKHTTREVSLYKFSNNGYIADTPGFSAIDISAVTDLEASDMDYMFKEFREYIGHCKFYNCAHISEIDCAIKKAMTDDVIAASRYKNYVYLVEKLKKTDKWN